MARFFDVIPVRSECSDIWCRCRIRKSIVLKSWKVQPSTFKVGLKALLMSPVVGGGESVENLSEFLSSLPLGQLARQHQVGVEVVGDEGGGQGPEVELQHGGDAVDVVEEGGVSGQVRHPLIVEQVSGNGNSNVLKKSTGIGFCKCESSV